MQPYHLELLELHPLRHTYGELVKIVTLGELHKYGMRGVSRISTDRPFAQPVLAKVNDALRMCNVETLLVDWR